MQLPSSKKETEMSNNKKGSSIVVLNDDKYNSNSDENNFKSDHEGAYNQEVFTNEELDVLEQYSQECEAMMTLKIKKMMT